MYVRFIRRIIIPVRILPPFRRFAIFGVLQLLFDGDACSFQNCSCTVMHAYSRTYGTLHLQLVRLIECVSN